MMNAIVAAAYLLRSARVLVLDTAKLGQSSVDSCVVPCEWWLPSREGKGARKTAMLLPCSLLEPRLLLKAWIVALDGQQWCLAVVWKIQFPYQLGANFGTGSGHLVEA